MKFTLPVETQTSKASLWRDSAKPKGIFLCLT